MTPLRISAHEVFRVAPISAPRWCDFRAALQPLARWASRSPSPSSQAESSEARKQIFKKLGCRQRASTPLSWAGWGVGDCPNQLGYAQVSK